MNLIFGRRLWNLRNERLGFTHGKRPVHVNGLTFTWKILLEEKWIMSSAARSAVVTSTPENNLADEATIMVQLACARVSSSLVVPGNGRIILNSSLHLVHFLTPFTRQARLLVK